MQAPDFEEWPPGRVEPESRRPADEPFLFDSVLGAVGNTPLVRLTRLYPDLGLRLFGKLEALNPGGSIKDRPALRILEEEMGKGRIDRDTVIVESSSGNMGVGLAQVCRYYGLRFICVIDPKTAEQNVRILETYGAEIERVEEPDPETGQFLPARIRRVESLVAHHRNSFWPNQYENRLNPASHYATTMREIVEALGSAPDYLIAATSTCGTIRGCGELIAEEGLSTKVIAVDSVGSQIFGDRKADRHIPGLGAAIQPPHLDTGLVWHAVVMSDLECVRGCRRLLDREAILAGGSSGAVVSAVERVRDRLPDGATCALIFADRGERYFDTVYSDRWVSETLRIDEEDGAAPLSSTA
jgi:cysteine synthase A